MVLSDLVRELEWYAHDVDQDLPRLRCPRGRTYCRGDGRRSRERRAARLPGRRRATARRAGEASPAALVSRYARGLGAARVPLGNLDQWKFPPAPLIPRRGT